MPFWASLISSDKIKATHFHSAKYLIDDTCARNDVENLEGLFVIYIQSGLSLKFNHLGDHATFLNLDTTINERTFIYKFNKDLFPFSIVRMAYKESNIPSIIFYSEIKGEFPRLAPSTLYLRDFMPDTKELLECMKKQGSKQNVTSSSLGKIILAHPESVHQFSISYQDLLNIFSEDKP